MTAYVLSATSADVCVLAFGRPPRWESSEPPDPAQRIRGKITSHSAREPHPPLLQRSESKGLTR